MPYTVRKRDCKQSSGKRGTYTLSYTDKKGKKHSNCHTSKKNAQAQIGAIEMPEGDENIQRKGQLITQDVSESYDVDPRDIFLEGIMVMVMEELLEPRSQT
jgi:hypothetical protein